MDKLNIALVDDDRILVDLLSRFLDEQPNLNVCTKCYDGDEFVRQLERITPDLVILDLRLKNLNGLETLAVVKESHPEIKVIVLSSYYNRSFMGFMLKSGANAFLPKETELGDLLQVIYKVAEFGHFFTKDQVDVLQEQVSNKAPSPVLNKEELLSDRETEVLKLICQQLTAREIGERLFITQRTVEGHKTSLLLKTGAKNTAGLVIYAVQKKVVNADEIVMI